MKQVIYTLLLVLAPTFSDAQHTFPYRLTPLRETAIGAPAIGLSGWGYALNRHDQPLTVDQINAFATPRFRFGVDRVALRYWSPRAAKRSDWMLYTALATPAAVAWLGKGHGSRKNKGVVTVMAFETLSLTYGLTSLTKSFRQRNRPFVYHQQAPLSLKLDPDARHSFFSGHTSMSAAACFFTAQVFSDLYPQSRYKPWVWGGAAVLPALTAFQRVRAGKHFPTDVAVGYALGAVAGILIPRIHWF